MNDQTKIVVPLSIIGVIFAFLRHRRQIANVAAAAGRRWGIGGRAIIGQGSAEGWAVTEKEQESFEFLWTLKGFCAFTGSDEIMSPLFKGGSKSQHLWQMRVNPRRKAEDARNLEFFSVYLILVAFGDGDKSNTRTIKARFQVSLLQEDGKPWVEQGGTTVAASEFKKGSTWGYDKLIPTKILALGDPATNRRLLVDDKLKIHCRVWIEGDVTHTIGNLGDFSVGRQRGKLVEDFGHLMRSGEFGDVSIVTGSKTFMAHKTVLAARSKVFSAMFQSGMIEASSSKVDITDFDEEQLEGMLEHVYTGVVEDIEDKAICLLPIAEKYDLSGLKEECEYHIATSLSVKTAAEVLVMAHLNNADFLKTQVIEFINRHKDEVKKTKEFQRVAQSNPAMASIFVDLYLSQQ